MRAASLSVVQRPNIGYKSFADVSTALPPRGVIIWLMAVSLVLAGGCQSDGSSRTTSSRCSETVTPVPYPERPATLTNDSVRPFVADLERAYQSLRAAPDENITNVTFDPTPDTVTATDDGWLVRIESGYVVYDCAGGGLGVTDGYLYVTYFVNKSAVYRAQGDETGIDPRVDGTGIQVSNSSTTTS